MNKPPQTTPASRPRRAMPVALQVSFPLLLAVAMAAGAWEFFTFAVRAAPAINLSILAALAVSAAMVVANARRLDHERTAFEHGMGLVAARAQDKFAQLPGELMVRLFSRLNGEGLIHGARLSDGVIDAEVRVAREEFEQRREPLQYAVGLMVALGLFGTFIGLLETLVSAAEVLGIVASGDAGAKPDTMAMFSRMVEALKVPLVSMGTAFSASMFGLVGSIIIGLMVVMLTRSTDRLMEGARAALHGVSDAGRASVKPVAALNEEFLARFLTDLTLHNRQAAEMLGQILQASASAVPAMNQSAASVQLLTDRIDRELRAFQQLPDVFARLDTLPVAVGQTNQELVRVNASLATQQSALSALTQQVKTQSVAQGQLVGEMRLLLESQLQALRELQAAQLPALTEVRRVADNVNLAGDASSARLTDLLAELKAMREPLAPSLQAMMAGTRQSGETGAALLAFMPAGIARLESALTRINERLAREEDVLRGHGELLRAGLDGEEARAAGLRVLGDAISTAAGNMDAVRHEVSLAGRAQRQTSGQLTDVIKAVEMSLGKMQGILDDQHLAVRILQGTGTPPSGEAGQPR